MKTTSFAQSPAHPRSQHLGVLLSSAGLAVLTFWVTGTLTPTVVVHGVVFATVLALAGAAIGLGPRRLRRLRWSARAGLALGACVCFVAVGALSRPTVASEAVPVFPDPVVLEQTESAPVLPDAEPAAVRAAPKLLRSGRFSSLEHPTRGRAQYVSVNGGRKVVLSDFRTDSGPDLRVLLVAGKVGTGKPRTSIDLGRLKGSSGNQQYTIPKGTDLDRYTTVLIYCRAFTVGFGSAALREP